MIHEAQQKCPFLFHRTGSKTQTEPDPNPFYFSFKFLPDGSLMPDSWLLDMFFSMYPWKVLVVLLGKRFRFTTSVQILTLCFTLFTSSFHQEDKRWQTLWLISYNLFKGIQCPMKTQNWIFFERVVRVYLLPFYPLKISHQTHMYLPDGPFSDACVLKKCT